MPTATGPRRQVLAHRRKVEKTSSAKSILPIHDTSNLESPLQNPLLSSTPAAFHTFKVKPTHTSSRPLQGPTVLPASINQSSNLQIHASSKPTLVEDQSYTISATQTIQYLDNSSGTETTADQTNLKLLKQFKSQGSKSTLDNSLIHSVYPPQGHADYWNVLPHVLFNDPETPWMFESPWLPGDPYLALFSFTSSELLVSDANLEAIAAPLRAADAGIKFVQNSTLSIPMTNSSFQSMSPKGASPLGSGASWGAISTSSIFIPTTLFQALMPRDKVSSPWLLSHVRSVDTSGMTDMDVSDSGTFAVTVSHRTGLLNPSMPTTVYTHLCVIPGKDGSGTAPTTVGLTGLCSVYSWSYTALPTTGLSVQQLLENLGDSIQPFRLLDSTLSNFNTNIVNNDSDDSNDSSEFYPWLQNRLTDGYTLVRYRPQTGEVTTALLRGPLIPNDPYTTGSPSLQILPSSDFGADLAVIDKDAGIIDSTYHTAWTLGRSLALSSRPFSSALMRLRGAIHNNALNSTKKGLDASSLAPVHRPISIALSGTKTASGVLKQAGTGTNSSNFADRWKRPATRPSARDVYSFAHGEIKDAYKKGLPLAAYHVATTASPDPRTPSDLPYDETLPPSSTDWSTVFSFILDMYFLSPAIPILNLIPDPGFLPKESIRTFYLDPTWMKAIVDGALSVGEHLTDEDDLRDVVKAGFDVYFASNDAMTGASRQLPRFGMFIRSELVMKYPNLNITAPLPPGSQQGQMEILRTETLDADLLLLLFDRVPGTGSFPQGIIIQPPGHQLSFMLGAIEDSWTFPTPSSPTAPSTVTQHWRSVLAPDYNAEVPLQENGNDSVTYTSASSPAKGFDFQNNVLITPDIGTAARASIPIGKPNDSLAPLLGAQLVSSFPKLIINDAAPRPDPPPPAPATPLRRVGWTVQVDSEQEPENPGMNVLDDDISTIWHTKWRDGSSPPLPHAITIDMKAQYNIGSLTYLPRQDGAPNGTIAGFEVWTSLSSSFSSFPTNFTKQATGTWPLDPTLKTATFPSAAPARFVTLRSLSGSGPWTSASEINILTTSTRLPPHSLQTAPRAPLTKFPPLEGQDPRPTVPAPSPIPPPINLPQLNLPQSLTFLQALALRDINDKSLYTKYFNNPNPQTFHDLGQPTGLLDPQLSINAYTLRSKLNVFSTMKYKLAIPASSPPSNYPVDLYFDLRLNQKPTNPTRILSTATVSIPITTPTKPGLLTPFPTQSPTNNPIVSPPQTSDPHIDSPPQNRITGPLIPRVRFTGLGQRYSIAATIAQNGSVFSVAVTPTITAAGAANPKTRQMSNSPDLSFVVEGVVVNGSGGGKTPTSYQVQVVEAYESWNTAQGTTGKAWGGTDVPVYLMDPNA